MPTSMATNGLSGQMSHSTAATAADIEKRAELPPAESPPVETSSRPKSLGAGTALAIGVFATTLTTLSLSLMEWRGVTVTNAYVADFFFAAFLGLLITAQWELWVGNGFSYTVFSAFGLFYAGYAAILTPSFGISAAYGNDAVEFNNALGFFMILWTVFVFTFLVASLPINLVYILIFLFVDLGFLLLSASYFTAADGKPTQSTGLKKASGVFCFLAGLVGWYLTFHLLLKDSLIELPVGDTSRYFGKNRKRA